MGHILAACELNRLFFVWLNDIPLDVLRSPRHTLVLWAHRRGGKLYIVRINHKWLAVTRCVYTASTLTLGRPWDFLSVVKLVWPSLVINQIWIVCKAKRMSRAQHLKLLVIYFKPRVPQYFLGRRSGFRQLLKKSFDEMLRLRADMVRNMQLLPLDVFVKLLIVLSFKRELTAQQSE